MAVDTTDVKDNLKLALSSINDAISEVKSACKTLESVSGATPGTCMAGMVQAMAKGTRLAMVDLYEIKVRIETTESFADYLPIYEQVKDLKDDPRPVNTVSLDKLMAMLNPLGQSAN